MCLTIIPMDMSNSCIFMPTIMETKRWGMFGDMAAFCQQRDCQRSALAGSSCWQTVGMNTNYLVLQSSWLSQQHKVKSFVEQVYSVETGLDEGRRVSPNPVFAAGNRTRPVACWLYSGDNPVEIQVSESLILHLNRPTAANTPWSSVTICNYVLFSLLTAPDVHQVTVLWQLDCI